MFGIYIWKENSNGTTTSIDKVVTDKPELVEAYERFFENVLSNYDCYHMNIISEGETLYHC